MAVGWGGRVNLYKRSMNRDLVEGMTDGCLKKAAPQRGGLVEDTSEVARHELDEYYKYTPAPFAYHVPVEPFVKVRSSA